MTRILVVDDHEMVRQGLRAVLEEQPGWVVCGEAVDGREAVAKARELKPDVVVLDFTMPGLNGLEATRQIRREAPGTEVVILTMHESGQLAREALAAGALGFVLKSEAGETLVSAIGHVLQHRPAFTIKVTELLFGTLAAESVRGETGGNSLTPREREIIQLPAEGRSTKEVAHVLGISVRTAETHRANLMRKLKIHSVSELVRYALREKIAAP